MSYLLITKKTLKAKNKYFSRGMDNSSGRKCTCSLNDGICGFISIWKPVINVVQPTNQSNNELKNKQRYKQCQVGPNVLLVEVLAIKKSSVFNK